MHEYQFVINGNDYNVKLVKISGEEATIDVNGTAYDVNISRLFKQKAPKLVRKKVVHESFDRPKLTERPGKDLGFNTIKAPLPGIILEITVKVGDEVKSGQSVLKMEAMKMENDIHASVSGKVDEIFVKVGEPVLEGAPLVKIV